MTQQKQHILEKYPEYEITIGMEVHVQLATQTKMFCACPNEFGERPNKNICPVCAGYPGTLPILNRSVVNFAILAGIATNSKIAKVTDFSRKHYLYPDLPKNFQITQGDKPICSGGFVPIELEDGSEKKVRLERIHMEEDAGKNIHGDGDESFVDLNRAGTPLLEIVTKPDLQSAYEVRAYLQRLRAIVQYLGISDANMEEGSFRADTNISVKLKEDSELGTRVELKNINSFKFISQAIEHEVERQIDALESGEKIKQETRLWNERKHETVAMRSKEDADDYRYFTEPDIPTILIDDEWIEKIREKMPELPHHKARRLQEAYEISSYEADVLVSNAEIANFFEATVELCGKPKPITNWILRDLLAYLNEHRISLSESNVTPELFSELINVIDQGIINSKVAQEVFLEMAETGKYPSIIIQEKDLKQIDSADELLPIIKEILESNPDSVAKYKAGNANTFKFFVGQAMKATKGKANPKLIAELLQKHLK